MSRLCLHPILLGLTLLSAANAGLAQLPAPPNPAEDTTIVVTGRKSSELERREFVRALTALSFGSGQIARFEQRICPAAIGLPAAQGAALAARLRRVAEAVGLATAKPGCAANVVVAVTTDKKAFMAELRTHHPEYFGDLSPSDIRRIARQPGPSTAWQLAGPPRSARGTDLFVDPSQGVAVNRTTESASRINAPTRPQFDGAVVVVERGALDGLTVTQLADYGAMRAFAAIDVARVDGATTPTILHVLEAPMGSEVPASLTAWDFAFLRSLYAAPPNLSPEAQRSAIQRAMEQAVDRAAK